MSDYTPNGKPDMNLAAAIERIMLQSWHGRTAEFEDALNEARDVLSEHISEEQEPMLQAIIDGIAWGEARGRAVGTWTTIIRILTPDGASLTFQCHDEPSRAYVQHVTHAVKQAMTAGRISGGKREEIGEGKE